jgi:hypothetical protein
MRDYSLIEVFVLLGIFHILEGILISWSPRRRQPWRHDQGQAVSRCSSRAPAR